MTEDMRLLDFYEARGGDHLGRTLADVQQFSLDRLEQEHDFIQWLFPLPTLSPVNPEAPTLSEHDIARFRSSAELAVRLRQSFEVMADFYGFQVSERGGAIAIVRSGQFEQRAANWLRPGNHNFLRITRILKSLTILGQKDLARVFLDGLATILADHRDIIGDRTWGFWNTALVED